MNTLNGGLYNLVLLAGTAYLVGWHNWSPWWFVLTAVFLRKIDISIGKSKAEISAQRADSKASHALHELAVLRKQLGVKK